MTLTPGAYLKSRRTAALLSIEDVAARLPTDPATPERDRAQQLKLIEADVQPASFRTIIALRAIFAFDLDVLGRLEAIAQGHDLPVPPLCRVCACSDLDGCTPWRGGPCAWATPDLCTACSPSQTAAVAASGQALIGSDPGEAA